MVDAVSTVAWLWSKFPLTMLLYSLACMVIGGGVFWWKKARDAEARAKARLQEAEHEARKICEDAEKYFQRKQMEIQEYARNKRLAIQAVHEDKIEKWRRYIRELETKLVEEKHRRESMKEEIRKALGAIRQRQNPNLRYIEQRLKKALSF